MDIREPKNREDLQWMLRSGMGRAILFLMNHDVRPYRDMILDSCLHNYAYDQQCEDNRAEYLYPLLKASGEEDYYREAILRALPEEEDSFDADQLLDFAVLFARDGDEQARSAIYDKLWRNNTSEPLTGYDQAVDLDGISGLVRCLEIIGSDPDLISSNDHDDSIIKTTENRTSIDEVHQALVIASGESPAVARVLDSMDDYSVDWTVDEIIRRRDHGPVGWDSLKAFVSEETTWSVVKDSPNFLKIYSYWAHVASDSEFEKAALDLDPEADLKRLGLHLKMFWRRAFPLDPNILIRLIDHPDRNVALFALNALKMVCHPDVRAFFPRLLEQPDLSDRAIGLLQRNYEPGDDRIIMRLVEDEDDEERLHSMGFDVVDTYRKNLVAEGVEPLMLVYEKGTCSNCRTQCIRAIQGIGEVPGWMIEECKYDAGSETRKLAKALAAMPWPPLHPYAAITYLPPDE